MKIKLDGWKKVKSDKEHTVLRNPEGHEIRVAHKPLSPKFRGQLASLPMAEGGNVDPRQPGALNFDGGGDIPTTSTPKLDSSADQMDFGIKGASGKVGEITGGGGGGGGLMSLLALADGGDIPNTSTPQLESSAKQMDFGIKGASGRIGDIMGKGGGEEEALARGGKVKMYAQGTQSGPVDSKDDSPEQIASDAAAQAPAAQAPPTVIVNNNPTPAPNSPPSAQQGSAPTSADSAPQSAQPQASAQQSAPQRSAEGAPASPMPPTVQGGPSAGQVPQDSPMPEYPTLQAPAIQQGAQRVANQQDMARQAYIKRHMDDTTGFAEDLNNGHISPKSYGEIADKHTLGRIGTMFGMLLGGIGSGATGQPNALIGMMDKEIDRDLTAQQNSKSNAQNLYNLTSQRVTAEANAGLTNVTSAERVLAQAKVSYQVMALHKMVQMTKTLPPGPQKQAGEQAIAMMAGKIRDGEYQLADKLYAMEQLAAPSAGNESSSSTPSPAQSQENAFKAHNEAMIKTGDPQYIAMAQNAQAKHFPYVNAVANDSIVPSDKELYKNLHQFNDKMEDLQAYMKAHGNVWDNMSPTIRNVAMQKAKETAMLYGNSIPISQTEGARNWLEEQFLAKNPIDVISQKLLGSRKVMKEIQNSNGLRQKDLLGKYGIDASKAQDQSASSSPAKVAEGTAGVFKGKPVIFTGGKWSYK